LLLALTERYVNFRAFFLVPIEDIPVPRVTIFTGIYVNCYYLDVKFQLPFVQTLGEFRVRKEVEIVFNVAYFIDQVGPGVS